MGYLEKYLYLSTTAVAPFYGTFLIIGLLFVPTSGHTACPLSSLHVDLKLLQKVLFCKKLGNQLMST